jgi:hypothetical protein
MPQDELLDSIKVIGEGIHAINIRLANMLPVAGFNDLKKKRDEAHEQQDFLIKLFIQNSTSRFIETDSELAIVNEEMKEILNDIADMKKVLDTVTKFVSAIDTFISAISQIV